jgi:hypothetical protein
MSRPVRPAVRRFAIAAAIVLLPIAAWTAWDYVEASRLAAVVEDLRARNEPVVPSHYTNRVVDRPDNAARYYEAAAALLDSSEIYGAAGLVSAFSRGTGDRAALVARARAWLAKNAESEQLLERATTLPFTGYSAESGYSYRTSHLSSLATLASYRAWERAEAGDGDGAARAVVQELRIGRALRASAHDPSLAGGGRAVRDLGRILEARPSDASLRALQDALGEEDRDAMVEESAREIRAEIIVGFWNTASGWYGQPALRAGGPLDAIGRFVSRPWAAHTVTAEIERMNELVAQAQQPWPTRIPVAPGGRIPPTFPDGYRRLHQQRSVSMSTILALTRTSLVAVALERYRLEHGGALPESLTAIVPAFLPAIPIDPLSGEPVRYRRSGDGYTAYSVGRNGKDEGGTSLQGLSPWWGPQQAEVRQAVDLGTHVSIVTRKTP